MPFQHTAARRRLDVLGYLDIRRSLVSTHSRPKAAVEGGIRAEVIESFNTQPPEGGCMIHQRFNVGAIVSTHSRPKAAALMAGLACARICFNTQPPEGGCSHLFYQSVTPKEFQHTAARRRLLVVLITEALVDLFQHTAARRRL